MGRYYYGDIEGKFGFACQPTDAGLQFGAIEQESGSVDYEVNRGDFEEEGSDKLNELQLKLELATGDNWGKFRNYQGEDVATAIWDSPNVAKAVDEDLVDFVLGAKMESFFARNIDLNELYYTGDN